MAKEINAKPVNLNLPDLPETLESYTGEDIRVPRLQVPQIRISYKEEDDTDRVAPKGEFVEYNIETKETKALGKKINIQILHHRQSLSAYKDLGGGNSESYYTPEISMKAKSAPLFMVTATNGKRQSKFLNEGEIKKDGPLRSMIPDLRYQRNLYVLHEGKLKSLVVYGASFSGFIDLTKELKGQSSSAFNLELSTKREKTGAVVYYPIIFTKKEALDMKVQEPVLKQLSDWFNKFDALMAEQQKSRADQAAVDRGDGPDEEPAKSNFVSNLPPARKNMSEDVKDEEHDRATLEKEAKEELGF